MNENLEKSNQILKAQFFYLPELTLFLAENVFCFKIHKNQASYIHYIDTYYFILNFLCSESNISVTFK